MEARDWRLIKMFAANVGWLVAVVLGTASWVLTLYWLPEPWSAILGFSLPVLFLLNICWDQAKHRLERQEMLEKRLADQLASMD